MKNSKIDLVILETKDEKPTKEQEGSLLEIEQPQDKNTYEILKTELEIEKEDSKRKKRPRIPFSFFSNVEINRVKYGY